RVRGAPLDPAAALGVDDGVNGPISGGRNTPELHPAQIDPYEPRPGGGDGVQRGIADVDMGTTGPPWPGWCWRLGSLWPRSRAVRARPGGRTRCPHRASATTSRIPTLPS